MNNKKNCCDEVEKFRVDAKREVGNRLTEIREKRNLTQLELICQFTTSPQTISGYSRWENGTSEPSVAFLKQLHESWGIDLNWLIAGDCAFVPNLPIDVRNAIAVLDDFRRDCIFRK